MRINLPGLLRRIHHGSLASALVVGGLLIALLIIGLVTFANNQSRLRFQQRADLETENLSRLLQHNVASIIDKTDVSLQTIAMEFKFMAIQGRPDRAALDRLFAQQRSLQPDVDNLRATDADGFITYGTNLPQGPLVSVADRDYFIRARAVAQSELIIDGPVISRTNQQPVMVFGRRLTQRDGAFAGIVYATISVEHFQNILSSLDLGAHGAASLRMLDLRLVARHARLSNPKDLGSRVVSARLREELKANPVHGSYISTTALDQTERSNVYRRIAPYPLYLIVGLATEDYLLGWRDQFTKFAWLGALSIAITFLSAWLIYLAWQRQNHAVAALAQEKQFSDDIINSLPGIFYLLDQRGRVIRCNQRFFEVSMYSGDEVAGRRGHEFFDDADAPRIKARIGEVFEHGEASLEAALLVKGGARIPYYFSGRLTHMCGRPYVVGVGVDISARRQAEERIQYMAHFDALTGLPNRTQLAERARCALAMAQRNQVPVALMFLDLDHFKDINDTLGHSVGDALLIELAARLRLVLREQDTVSRLGGDEFVFLLHGADADGAARVAQKLLDVVAAPCRVEHYKLNVSGSIGIALYPADGTDLETLSKSADAAMYRAKQEGRNTYRFFTAELQARSARHLELVNALRQALEFGQLKVHYQPQVSLRDGRIVGAEALLRWNHPELGPVSPAEFIPAAEYSGLILPIGEWVLRHAVRQAKAWMQDGMAPPVMAVNLSAIQFRHPDLPNLVTRILQEEGLAPQCLELELTEGVAMHDPQGAIATMNDLHERGVRMSIDDFGTGYSSLSHLKKFKICKLKIDQSFVRDISTDPEDRAIVSTIIQMAKNLGLRTIAEGVETAQQLAFLRGQGCDEVQGYYVSKPLAAEQFEAFARAAPARLADAAAREDAATLAV